MLPTATGTSYVRRRAVWGNSNQILHGDQTRLENIHKVDHAACPGQNICDKTADAKLFAVAKNTYHFPEYCRP